MVAARNVKWLPREISEDSEGRLLEGIQVLTEAFVCSWTSFGGEGPFVCSLIPNFQENPQTPLPRTSTTSMPESALIPAKMSSKAVRILVLGSVNSP